MGIILNMQQLPFEFHCNFHLGAETAISQFSVYRCTGEKTTFELGGGGEANSFFLLIIITEFVSQFSGDVQFCAVGCASQRL